MFSYLLCSFLYWACGLKYYIKELIHDHSACLKVLENNTKTINDHQHFFFFFQQVTNSHQYCTFFAYMLLIKVMQIFSFMVITEYLAGVIIYFAGIIITGFYNKNDNFALQILKKRCCYS